MPLPRGWVDLSVWRSIFENKHKRFPMPDTLSATSAIGIRFSEHTKFRRKDRRDQVRVVLFSFVLFPRSALFLQTVLG
jgi:hypothetical protein